MALQVTAIMLGVEDLARSKRFYADGLGCTIEQDYPSFVSLNLGDGSSLLRSTRGKQRPKMPGSRPTDRGSEASHSTTSSPPKKRWTKSWARPPLLVRMS